jgi:hypothetical protein
MIDCNYFILLTWDTDTNKLKPGFMVVCKAILFDASVRSYELGNNGIVFSSPLNYSLVNEQIRKNMQTPYMLVDITNSIKEKKFNGFFPGAEDEILQAVSLMKQNSIQGMTDEQVKNAIKQAVAEQEYEEAAKLRDEIKKRGLTE